MNKINQHLIKDKLCNVMYKKRTITQIVVYNLVLHDLNLKTALLIKQ